MTPTRCMADGKVYNSGTDTTRAFVARAAARSSVMTAPASGGREPPPTSYPQHRRRRAARNRGTAFAMSEDPMPSHSETEPSLHEALTEAFELCRLQQRRRNARRRRSAGRTRRRSHARRARAFRAQRRVRRRTIRPPARRWSGTSARTIRPPASWSATAKAASPARPRDPAGSAEAGKGHGTGQGPVGPEGRTSEPPRRDPRAASRTSAADGWITLQAIQALFAAQDLLERDPVDGLTYLARQYGVDLSHLGAADSARAAQPPSSRHPRDWRNRSGP